MNSISNNSEKGKRIIEFLKKELQIPEDVSSFSVNFSLDSFITVDCSYFPREKECGK